MPQWKWKTRRKICKDRQPLACTVVHLLPQNNVQWLCYSLLCFVEVAQYTGGSAVCAGSCFIVASLQRKTTTPCGEMIPRVASLNMRKRHCDNDQRLKDKRCHYWPDAKRPGDSKLQPACIALSANLTYLCIQFVCLQKKKKIKAAVGEKKPKTNSDSPSEVAQSNAAHQPRMRTQCEFTGT